MAPALCAAATSQTGFPPRNQKPQHHHLVAGVQSSGPLRQLPLPPSTRWRAAGECSISDGVPPACKCGRLCASRTSGMLSSRRSGRSACPPFWPCRRPLGPMGTSQPAHESLARLRDLNRDHDPARSVVRCRLDSRNRRAGRCSTPSVHCCRGQAAHRVVLVLQQGGALLLGKPVGVLMLCRCRHGGGATYRPFRHITLRA